MKKTFSFRPRSEVFEQYKGVGGHFGHICYTHILYISASPATPRGTLLTIARRTARFRRPVLHVQVGNRQEKTFGQQAGLLRACESHAVRSANTQECSRTRTLHSGVSMRSVCAPLILCALTSPARSYATRCFLLPPRSGEACKARHATWGCVQSQAAPAGALLELRPLANACLCEALARQTRGSYDFCAVLLKNNKAGFATALRGDRRLCRQTPAAAAGRQQPQLDVVRQMPFLQHLQGA